MRGGAGALASSFTLKVKSQRKARGWKRMQELTVQQEDETALVINARRRVLQIVKRDALSVMCEHPIGLCIMALHPAENQRAKLWKVWEDMSAARRRWRLRIIGQTGTPKGSSIAVIPEVLVADEQAEAQKADDRSDADKDDAAKKAEAYWQSEIAAVVWPQQRSALRSAIDEFGGALWEDGKPTGAGRAATLALEAILQNRH